MSMILWEDYLVRFAVVREEEEEEQW